MQKLVSFVKSFDKKTAIIAGCAAAGCVCGWILRTAIKRIKAVHIQKNTQNDHWLDGWKSGYAEAFRGNGYAIGFKDGYNQAVNDIAEANGDTEACAYQQGYYNGIAQNMEYPDDINSEWL